jgi:hypothetical protein
VATLVVQRPLARHEAYTGDSLRRRLDRLRGYEVGMFPNDQRSHVLDQPRHIAGFGKEAVVLDRVRRRKVTGRQHDFQVAGLRPQPPCEGNPIDVAAHAHVGKHHGNVVPIGKHLQRLAGVCRFDDKKAGDPQLLRDHHPHQHLVVDDQDRRPRSPYSRN